MSYTDLRDFVPEYVALFENSNIVLIEKSGGGTSGNYYIDENWRYVVALSDGPSVYVCAKGTMRLSGLVAHEDAARRVFDFYSEGDI